MRHISLLLGVIQAVAVTRARYVRNFSYVSEDFFSHWHFETQKDPTHGFVKYVDFETALADGLVNATSNRVFMSADRNNTYKKGGRPSVRIVSKAVYNRGLFIVSMDHVPTGCGMWPAVWMLGMKEDLVVWPTWGEYDLMEGVHKASRSYTSLHTVHGCDQSKLIPGKDFSTKWGVGASKDADNCDINAPGQWQNQGCSQQGPAASMGPDFNAKQGGTYAAEWDPDVGFIQAWFWSAGSEPADLVAGKPDPTTWGVPFSKFVFHEKTCPRRHVQNMHIIYDLTFCGDLAGKLFRPMCPHYAKTMSCEELVGSNLEEMAEAYWSIRGLDVYLKADQPEREDAANVVLRKFSSAKTPYPGGSMGLIVSFCSLAVAASALLAAGFTMLRRRSRQAARCGCLRPPPSAEAEPCLSSPLPSDVPRLEGSPASSWLRAME